MGLAVLVFGGASVVVVVVVVRFDRAPDGDGWKRDATAAGLTRRCDCWWWSFGEDADGAA